MAHQIKNMKLLPIHAEIMKTLVLEGPSWEVSLPRSAEVPTAIGQLISAGMVNCIMHGGDPNYRALTSYGHTALLCYHKVSTYTELVTLLRPDEVVSEHTEALNKLRAKVVKAANESNSNILLSLGRVLDYAERMAAVKLVITNMTPEEQALLTQSFGPREYARGMTSSIAYYDCPGFIKSPEDPDELTSDDRIRIAAFVAGAQDKGFVNAPPVWKPSGPSPESFNELDTASKSVTTVYNTDREIAQSMRELGHSEEAIDHALKKK